MGTFAGSSGRAREDIELSYTDPELFGSLYSATVGVQSSRDRFQTFDLGTRRKTGGFLSWAFRPFVSRSAPPACSWGIPCLARTSAISTRSVWYGLPGLITNGTRSTISARLVRDTREGGLFPTGNRNQLAYRKTGGWLGGDGDYDKWDFDSEWFSRIAQIGGGVGKVPIEVVAGLSFKAGLVFGDNPFYVERFYVGGTQVGQRVRGYEEATITPQGHVPRNAPVNSLARVGEAFFADHGIARCEAHGQHSREHVRGWRQPLVLLVGVQPDGPPRRRRSRVEPGDAVRPRCLYYAYGFDRGDVVGRPDPGWQLHFRFGQLF